MTTTTSSDSTVKQYSESFPTCPPQIIQVGRQPILDRRQHVYGYELLYRSEDKGPAPGLDGNLATARTLLYTFVEFGIKRLVGSHRLFVNFTQTFFTEIQPLPLDKKRLVIEVLEDIHIAPEIVEGIRAHHDAGYVIALDDYRFEPHWQPLLPYCKIIKVDIRGLDLQAHAEQIGTLKSLGLLLLAEKVETQEEFKLCLQMGFDLFQGYFFAKPQVVTSTALQSNQILLLKIIARLNDSDCEIEELASLVSQDPTLSFKILRFINSVALGLRRKVQSIKEAVVYIGMQRLRAWATLFVMAGMSTKTPEIITVALVRAEFCQLLRKAFSQGNPDEGYTIGLLSILDALLDQPMKDLARDLPLPKEMIDALIKHTGAYGHDLEWALALEQGELPQSVSDALPAAQLNAIYIEALIKAEEIRKALD